MKSESPAMHDAITRRGAIGAALAAAAAMALPRHAFAGPASDARVDAILARVDPELRESARRLVGANAFPPLTLSRLTIGRTVNGPPDLAGAMVPFSETRIAGPKGAPDVRLQIINARPRGSNRPVLLHTHGGGYVMGTASASVLSLQDICLALDCPAVSVDYRLAPETTFAGSVEDNYAALKWLHANAGSLGADPARIALIGESAGGGHAALLAIAARDRREVPVAFQCLIYPMLDDRTGSTRKVAPGIGEILWTTQSNRFGWSSFLGVPAGSAKVPARGVPARTRDLAGLPPTFIGTGAIDLFVDEDIDYGQRLLNSGVPTEIVVVPGAFHGFDVFAPESSPARKFRTAMIEALRRALSA